MPAPVELGLQGQRARHVLRRIAEPFLDIGLTLGPIWSGCCAQQLAMPAEEHHRADGREGLVGAGAIRVRSSIAAKTWSRCVSLSRNVSAIMPLGRRETEVGGRGDAQARESTGAAARRRCGRARAADQRAERIARVPRSSPRTSGRGRARCAPSARASRTGSRPGCAARSGSARRRAQTDDAAEGRRVAAASRRYRSRSRAAPCRRPAPPPIRRTSRRRCVGSNGLPVAP